MLSTNMAPAACIVWLVVQWLKCHHKLLPLQMPINFVYCCLVHRFNENVIFLWGWVSAINEGNPWILLITSIRMVPISSSLAALPWTTLCGVRNPRTAASWKHCLTRVSNRLVCASSASNTDPLSPLNI